MSFHSLLLEWYDVNKRTLPWRGSRDPYIIWVSEIIFQQTRIEQGTGYFLRFTERFPDLKSLASAAEDEVLRLWQGLGYYSRARNMHYTARLIIGEHDGRFPKDFSSIKKLKGVGDYTASCIASICFGEVQAAVDGNVYRVLSRISADKTPIDSSRGKVKFRDLAQKLISPDRPGDYNEAIMDLGSMVCKPRNPLCGECPLSAMCQARVLNIQGELPVKSPTVRKSVPVMNYLLLRRGSNLLVHKREDQGIWKGLYELPVIHGDLDSESLVAECEANYGMKPEELKEIKRIKHVLTHADLDIRFFEADPIGEPVVLKGDLLEVPSSEIVKLPFPKPLVDFLVEKRDT